MGTFQVDQCIHASDKFSQGTKEVGRVPHVLPRERASLFTGSGNCAPMRRVFVARKMHASGVKEGNYESW